MDTDGEGLLFSFTHSLAAGWSSLYVDLKSPQTRRRGGRVRESIRRKIIEKN